MIEIIQGVISSFIGVAQDIFDYIFDGIELSVLWSWLPTDIQTAAAAFIAILFAIAIINGVRKFLPF